MNTNANIKQGYKQTSLGILPQEWEVVRLGDICEFLKGKGISKDDLADNGIPCIRYGELYTIYDEIIQKVVSRTNLDSGELIFSKANDIVLPTSGETAIDICKASCVMIDNVALGGDLNVLRSKQNGAFLSYYINHMAKYDIAKLAQGVSIVHLYASELKSLQIPLPPLAEQEKIAQILSVWDKGISVLKSLIEAKTKHKKALMQRLLTPPCESPTPSLRASETNAAIYNKSVDCHDLTASNLAMTEKNSKTKQSLRFAEFTDKWQEMRLGDICEIIMGQSPSGHAVIASERSERGNPQKFTKTLTMDCHENPSGFSRNDKAVEFHQGKIYFTDKFLAKSDFVTIEPLKIAEPNSILLCVRAPVGVVNFTQRKIAIGRGLCAIKANKAHNEFIYFILLSLKDYFESKSAGSTFSAINSNEVKNVKIPLPPLAEQKKIAQVLSACDKEIELLKSKFQCLKTQKKGLMQRLLNGEVRVKC